ncbi:MAG: phage holin family protein, partial [Neisseria sp.]|nr:phage holin family protein [Neisseria sp.]
NQGIDLLLLRLQILNLDLAEQAENVFRIIIWLVVSGILLLIAFISLLFGLNRALSDTAAIWVFFGITALSLIVIAILFGKVSKDWRSQNNQIAATLQDIRADIACLRGQDMQEGGDDE